MPTLPRSEMLTLLIVPQTAVLRPVPTYLRLMGRYGSGPRGDPAQPHLLLPKRNFSFGSVTKHDSLLAIGRLKCFQTADPQVCSMGTNPNVTTPLIVTEYTFRLRDGGFLAQFRNQVMLGGVPLGHTLPASPPELGQGKLHYRLISLSHGHCEARHRWRGNRSHRLGGSVAVLG